MANDLFGGLGGLMKGLSGFMPKDDPNVKVMTAQTDLNDFLSQETELYAAIGKKAVQAYGMDVFAEEGARLKLPQEHIAQAQAKLDAPSLKGSKKNGARRDRKRNVLPAAPKP